MKDFDIECGKILKLINGLNPHKAHGHDGISIRMVKLCNLTTTRPQLCQLCIKLAFSKEFFKMTGKKVI